MCTQVCAYYICRAHFDQRSTPGIRHKEAFPVMDIFTHHLGLEQDDVRINTKK